MKYSLKAVTELMFSKDIDHKDYWRRRYAELESSSLTDWPALVPADKESP